MRGRAAATVARGLATALALGAAFGAVVAVVIAGLGREGTLQRMGDFLVVRDTLAPSDAVIAVSGDGPERVATSIALMRQGLARRLVISGGLYGRGINAAHVMRDQALDSGVPAAEIIVDDGATSTAENALGAARVMRAHGLRSAILVTSPYHTRRAGMMFRRVFLREGLALRVHAVEGSFFHVDGWWTRPEDRSLVVGEYLKLVAYVGGVR
jgi:uncharacterized SAM-binding protein YcdF (DUF218 family)